MPKMKTHSGIKKRVKITGTGKIFFKKTGLRHLNMRNTNANKRRKQKMAQLIKGFEKVVYRMMPYA
jgi:large subunit ribosomal protein L35